MDFSIPETTAERRREGAGAVHGTVPGPTPAARRRWVAQVSANGATASRIPVALGGNGRDARSTGSLLSGLSAAVPDPAAALAVAANGLLVTESLWRLGDLRRLQPIITGEAIGAIDLTEADGGAHPTGVTANRTGNGWELTGSKRWVVNAGIADHFLLTATGDDGSRTAFVIDARSPGILTEEIAGPGAPWIAPVRLDRVQVHDDAVLGTVGAALTELVPVLTALDRSLMLTVWLGALQDLTEQTRALALADGSRFGRPAGRSQAARFGLADLISHLDLFSGLVQRALWQFDARPEALRVEGAAARLYLSLHIDTMLTAAGEVAGPLPGHRLLHLLAAAPLLRVASGPQITRPVLAAAMTGLGGSTILEETR